MKTYELEGNEAYYQSFFESLKDLQTPLISWQVEVDGSKNVLRVQVADFHLQSRGITFSTEEAGNSFFNTGLVFFFSKEKHAIFKAQVGMLPAELMKLDEDEIEEFTNKYQLDKSEFFVKGHGFANKKSAKQMVRGKGEANIQTAGYMKYEAEHTTERIDTKWHMSSMSKRDADLFETELSFILIDAEDEKYASKRATPRARPPKGKQILVSKSGGADHLKNQSYSLFDLSRGGVSFLTSIEAEFEVGTQINILGFDSNEFDEPMIADVRAVRETDETRSLFKVGCSFNDLTNE